jgi:hypothetical protein
VQRSQSQESRKILISCPKFGGRCSSMRDLEVAKNTLPISLAGNVADMSRHVGDDTTCRSNFGQMGPCRRHKI